MFSQEQSHYDELCCRARPCYDTCPEATLNKLITFDQFAKKKDGKTKKKLKQFFRDFLQRKNNCNELKCCCSLRSFCPNELRKQTSKIKSKTPKKQKKFIKNM